MTVYRIAKWESVFENAESRKLKKLNWVAMPVGFSSTGYQSMLDEFGDDASAIYGAWCALTGIAASCAVRGVLGNSRGNPLKISHIARMTGFRSAIFERLYAWAASEEVGWLEPLSSEEVEQIYLENAVFPGKTDGSGESPDDPPTRRENFPATGNGREWKGMEGQNHSTAASLASAALRNLDLQEVSRLAAKLSKACRSLTPETAWQLTVIAEATAPGMVSEFLSKVHAGSVRTPKRYLEGMLRKECNGFDWQELIPLVPPQVAQQMSSEEFERRRNLIIREGRKAGQSEEEIQRRIDAISLPKEPAHV